MSRRYLINFDSAELPRIDTDFLVIGSGSAGLRAAIEANRHGDVVLITKGALQESSTRYAQGGIAVAMSEDDEIGFHVEDTLKAGVGLCNEIAVQIMVEEGIERVSELIQWGANFDKEGETLGFTQEAAHQRRRIVHRGDATGAETTQVLVTHLKKQKRIQVIEHAFAVDFMTQDNTCYGVAALIDSTLHCIFAKATILAAGGLGRIYQCTSNPEVATGDGFALAWRAGCEMMDMEFVQFHPTTLFLMGAPHFLISEALRGEGGTLISGRGERFMGKYHELEELAPRDVVSRANLSEMELTDSPCVYLDITHLSPNFIQNRFPTIYHTCNQYGIDITTDLIPVRPGAHFMMGGVRTNMNAETGIRGLTACGEVACTGVHGANRLASNSLLECIVFGTRAGKAAAKYAGKLDTQVHASVRIQSNDESESSSDKFNDTSNPSVDINTAQEMIRELMWRHAGILRNGGDLKKVADALAPLDQSISGNQIEALELQNMLEVARLITRIAIARTESRGGHYREDYSERDDTNWRKHLVVRRNEPMLRYEPV